MRTYSLELQEAGDASAPIVKAEINQKPKTPAPMAGETLSGTIQPNQNPDFPPKFKKESKEGGGFSGGKGSGTFKPRDPSEIAGARHAHNLLVAAHSFPPLEYGDVGPHRVINPEHIQARIDDLDAFACVLDEKTAAISDAAKQGAGAPKKDDGSDLPF